jgi:hypothetical protein
LKEVGFIDAEMVGETGFSSSPVTKGVLFLATKAIVPQDKPLQKDVLAREKNSSQKG